MEDTGDHAAFLCEVALDRRWCLLYRSGRGIFINVYYVTAYVLCQNLKFTAFNVSVFSGPALHTIDSFVHGSLAVMVLFVESAQCCKKSRTVNGVKM